MRIWLSPVVFDWEPYPGATIPNDSHRVRRPHAILAHVEEVLSKNESEFSIADSILGLKRAINSRLRHLDEIYGFRELFPKQVGSLERLEQVGLARPFLIKQLFELRNDIEHEDVSPPCIERARELIDTVWYFLRATDAACKSIPCELNLRSLEEGSYSNPVFWLNVEILRDHCQRRFRISGWLSSEFISEIEQPGFLLLELSIIRSKSSEPTDPVDPTSMRAYSHNAARGDDERWIQAQVDIPHDLQRQIWRLAFETL
ncbi:MAG: hypothetical protein J0H48_07325 [Nitrosospira multiformis]|nr:hypothetical protein [Nitrosospira multiformis]